MRENKSIIYVNYSPYENSGKILDYLLENFEVVFLFSIGFHHLKNKKNYNILYIYKHGKLIEKHSLFQLPILQNLVFILIPIRSIITCVEIMLYTFFLQRRYKQIDLYFSVNAFTAWIGNVIKQLGIVKKTIFWVWDYYPPIHENKIIMLMRTIYWQFDKMSSYSDRVAFVNRRLLILRKDIGIYDKEVEHPIIPIGTDKFSYKKKIKVKPIIFGFIGVIKKSQGVDIIFNSEKELLQAFGKIEYELIGSGPDENYFKKRANRSHITTKFYGYLEGESFNEVLKHCTIGIATYIPDASNVSHYGDPGKIKRYLSLGIPVITTDVLDFSKEIEKKKAGIIVDYANPAELVKAVKKIMADYDHYSKNAYLLSQKYFYKKIYPDLFSV